MIDPIAISNYISERTDGGKKIVEGLVRIILDKKTPRKVAVEAATALYLWERRIHGR